MKHRFHPECEIEIDRAAKYLEQRRAGYYLRFTSTVEKLAIRLTRFPHHGDRQRSPTSREFRKTLVPRFRYVMIFEVTASEIIVIAVFHGHRNRVRWRSRI